METNEDSLARLVNRQMVKIRELQSEKDSILKDSKIMVELVDANIPDDYLKPDECKAFRNLQLEIAKVGL